MHADIVLLRRLTQGHLKFKAHLGYKVNSRPRQFSETPSQNKKQKEGWDTVQW